MGRVSLSTKKLEPTPGDMLRDPQLVFERADEMAAAFRASLQLAIAEGAGASPPSEARKAPSELPADSPVPEPEPSAA